MSRPRFKQFAPLDQRLSQEAERLRKEAEGIPPGIEHEKLIRRARQAETASHIQEWLTSPGLRAPLYRAFIAAKTGISIGYEPCTCANDSKVTNG